MRRKQGILWRCKGVREGWLGASTENVQGRRKGVSCSGGEQEASSELPLHSTFVSLSLSFVFIRSRFFLFPSHPRPNVSLSSPYLGEAEKWFLVKEASKAFPPNVSSSLSNVISLLSLGYKYILQLTLIAGNAAK